MTDTQQQIALICDQIKELLLAKNLKYGDSALNPTRVFSKATPVEQLLVRIDDKLSRITKGVGLIANDEDVINDLIGYLVLLKIALVKDSTVDQWDGSDIIQFPATGIKIGDSNIKSIKRCEAIPYNDTYKSGDKFS